VIYIYKNPGETPLEALDRLRVEKPEYKDERLSYAGRLDPMAEGVMLIMIGEENKEREKYLNMGKVYEFEVLFGFATDTFDLLGLVTDYTKDNIELNREQVADALKNFKGIRSQIYPAYSSKTVAGRPLFEYARAGKLDEIEMPTREVEIFDIELLDVRRINKMELAASLAEKIGKVKGDFRQQEILGKWGSVLVETNASVFHIAKIRMHCSSGTYARSVASELGGGLGLPALAYSIKRIAYK
jgi:tRNA pseudouridine55 synthase